MKQNGIRLTYTVNNEIIVKEFYGSGYGEAAHQFYDDVVKPLKPNHHVFTPCEREVEDTRT